MRRGPVVMALCVALLLAILLCPSFASGSVLAPPRGDANADGIVDLFDLVIISSAYNPAGPVSDPRADINGDGVVNLFDLVLGGANFNAPAARPPVPTEPLGQATPLRTSTVVPPPTAIPEQAGMVPPDEAGFREYLRQNYGVIAGQAISFEQIDIYRSDGGGTNSVSLRLTGDSADVFGEQTERAAVDYARRLLDDTRAFFSDQDCSAYVRELWYTEDPWYWLGEEWYYVGGYSSRGGWRVWQTYVRAHFLEGRESIDVWNYR